MPFTKALRRACPTNLGFELLSHISTDNGAFSLQIDSSLQDELQSYQKCKNDLLYIPFSTVDEYLAQLEAISQLLDHIYSSDARDLRTSVLFFLAAAVSDFYLPPHKLSEHKIQSGAGLVLELDPVPKLLPLLTSSWAPRSYVVSFKLETERSLVVEKATRAIHAYGVHSVVANQLQVWLSSLCSSSLSSQTRRDVVHIVDGPAISRSLPSGDCDGVTVTDVCRANDEAFIEPRIVEEIMARHSLFISAGASCS
jgi:hypothetical protein